MFTIQLCTRALADGAPRAPGWALHLQRLRRRGGPARGWGLEAHRRGPGHGRVQHEAQGEARGLSDGVGDASVMS